MREYFLRIYIKIVFLGFKKILEYVCKAVNVNIVVVVDLSVLFPLGIFL